MILERNQLRERAVRLMAMAICAETTQRYETLMEMSRVAQIGAGVQIGEDDDDVQALVAVYSAEDKNEATHQNGMDDWEADHPGARCPPRE